MGRTRTAIVAAWCLRLIGLACCVYLSVGLLWLGFRGSSGRPYPDIKVYDANNAWGSASPRPDARGLESKDSKT